MEPLDYAPPPGSLVVLHHDRDLLVVDKPSGCLSVPGRGAALADSALSRAQALDPRALAVHRLDLGTSGVLVFALRRKAEAALRAQFAERRVEKEYVARVWGRPAASEGTIELALAPDPERPPLQRVDPAGRPALTRWRLEAEEPGGARLALFPSTGRSHQLRVHLAAVGLPILGDPFYAPPAALAAAPRLCLHARRLVVTHPYTGARLTFEAPAPF